jgi:medium-chain acyl-[acyl-carrier-protein] hydrolase
VTDRWFSVPRPKPDAEWRLVCFPHAGGGASSFVPWARALEDTPVEVAILKLPGREARVRELPIDDLALLVEHVGRAVSALDARPTVWFGHSSGARVAFETLRWLRARGRELPDRLFVSGAPAPDVPRTAPTLHTIEDDREFLQAVAESYGGVPQLVLDHDELRSLIVPALRADLKIHERYVYKDEAPLPLPITAYGGLDDASVPERWLTGWQRHTAADFSHQMFPGHHFFLHDARADVLRLVRDAAPAARSLQNVI